MKEIKKDRLYDISLGISTLTDEEVNEAISEMMELKESRDHTGPAAYLEAMAVAMEQEWWDDFVYAHITNAHGNGTRTVKVLFASKLGSHALALYLYAHKCS